MLLFTFPGTFMPIGWLSRWPMVIIDHIFLPGHSGWSSTHLTPWPSSETCLPRERWISLTFPVKCNPFVDQELAEQSEILETVGDQDPSQFYYGQVTFISTVTLLCARNNYPLCRCSSKISLFWATDSTNWYQCSGSWWWSLTRPRCQVLWPKFVKVTENYTSSKVTNLSCSICRILNEILGQSNTW